MPHSRLRRHAFDYCAAQGQRATSSQATFPQADDPIEFGLARREGHFKRESEIFGSVLEVNRQGAANVGIVGSALVKGSQHLGAVAHIGAQASESRCLKGHGAQPGYPIEPTDAQPRKRLREALLDHWASPLSAISVAEMPGDTSLFNPTLWGGQTAPEVAQELRQAPQIEPIVVFNPLKLNPRVPGAWPSEKIREHGWDES